MDDSQIVELYLHRKEEAITCTAQQYGMRLRQISETIVKDHQTALECENDTYLQAWNSIPPHAPRHYLFPFLARIIRHISIDRCRHQKRLCRNGYIQELSAELQCCIPDTQDVESQIDAIVLGECISLFLRRQSALTRQVFIRRYWYLDSIEQICLRYHISPSKTKSMLFRCRNALRKHLEKEGFTL